jgi:hypothetical protein
MKFFFKQILKISAFYLEKQKSFIPRKNLEEIQNVTAIELKRAKTS